MKRFVSILITVAVYWVHCDAAVAVIVQEMSLEGIGTDLPLDSVDFSMFGYPNGHSNSGGGRTTKPTVSDIVITRMSDSASPKLLEAAVKGKVFKKVEIYQCEGGCLAPSKYMTYTLENAIISSYMPGPVSDPIPTESIAMNYQKFKLTYLPSPVPPQTAWSIIMPQSLPPGGMEPYSFNFNLTSQSLEALFIRPPSPLGDVVPTSLLNTSAVPEPGAVWLAAIGALAVLGGRRRERIA